MSKDKQVQQDTQSKSRVSKPAQDEMRGVKTVVANPIPSLQRAFADPKTLSPADAQTLQRTLGNQALRRLTIQRKMTVGPVGDKYEQEADAVAKQVVSKLHTTSTQTAPAQTTQRQEEEELQMKPLIQRQEEEEELQMKPLIQRQEEDELQMKPIQRQEDEEELQMKPLPNISSLQRQEEEELQMKAIQRQQEEEELQAKGDPMLTGGELSSDVESSVQSAKSGGQPISANIRGPLEQAFNADFSNVKIHADSQADTLNRSLSARAFTSGQDVFFRSGEYNPNNTGGQELLAHELTHVVQQNSGVVQRQGDPEGNKGALSSIQRKKDQNHYFAQIGNFSNGSSIIQRTIDQDARLWAMDWLATWTRAFPQAVKKYNLPKLYGICTGVMGDENPLAPVAVSQVDRATYTTALATGLVKLGAEKAGRLSARLGDQKEGLVELLQELNNTIPDDIPGLKLATPQTQQDFQELKLPDPFLVLASGGAQFTFSQAMAMHMMRRHHPKYLSGPPMQVQSYFDEDTTIKGIEAIIRGTIINSQNEIKEWRKFRALKSTDLASDRAKTLNLRPVWDGRYWELTLTLDSTNRQESKGVVAHFTPTL
ncbi:MAG: DUF4157 domain-containing protein [Anaerolineae bacterium]|nr:DUF4157 domain-containing protein [Anaerolineae bacterium]